MRFIGPEFESRIRQNEINNPKFNFLNPGDPYHAYFQQKVADIKEQDDKGEIDGCSMLTRLKFDNHDTVLTQDAGVWCPPHLWLFDLVPHI